MTRTGGRYGGPLERFLLGVAALLGICGAANAQRSAPDAAATIQARQGNYKQMAGALKGISDQLRSGSPAVAEVRPRAALLADRSIQVLRWFPRGTGSEARVRTRARPEIWSDPAGFQRAGATFVVAAQALNRAAQAGDLAEVRAAFPGVQRACAGCHDRYRAPEQ